MTAEPTGPLEVAFSGELRAAGFDVEVIAPPAETPSWAVLRDLARHHDLAATVWFSGIDGHLTVWVVDRMTGKMLVRELPGPAPSNGEQAKLGALRGIELLRASLRELDEPSAKVAAEVTPPPAAKRLGQPKEPSYFLDVGGGVAGSAGGVGPTGQAWIGARLMFHEWVGLRFGAMLPVVGTPLRDAEGYARISIVNILVGAHAALRKPGVVVRPDVGLLAGLGIVHFDGVASPPLLGRTDQLLAFVARLGFGLSFRLSRAVRLRADAAVGIAVPQPEIAFLGRSVGRWGMPFGTGTLAFEVGLF